MKIFRSLTKYWRRVEKIEYVHGMSRRLAPPPDPSRRTNGRGNRVTGKTAYDSKPGRKRTRPRRPNPRGGEIKRPPSFERRHDFTTKPRIKFSFLPFGNICYTDYTGCSGDG